MRRLNLIIWCSLLSLTAEGQLNNMAFENRMAINPPDSGKFYFGLNLLGFAKNNEYFDTTVDGYTLFGYQINPYLSLQLTSRLRLDAGVYLQQDFGSEDFSQIDPTFSLKYKWKNSAFIFGTLEGSLHHGLIEPLYDFEKVMNDRLENGFQFLWMKEGLFLDAWVNWQNMIYLGDPEQEEFTFGLSINKRIYNGNSVSIEIPLQFMANHHGGQIDQSNDPVTTYYNAAAGVHLYGTSAGLVTSWGVKAFGTAYQDDSSTGSQPFKDGYGVYFNPYVSTRYGFTLMASYWMANEFISPQGGLIYPSANELYPTRIDEERQLIMLRLLFDKKLADSLWLTLRAEPFYDTYSESLQYSFGLYLNFYDRFFLTTVKRDR